MCRLRRSYALHRLAAGVAVSLVAALAAATPLPAQAPAASRAGVAPCAESGPRSLDFWLGDWDVYRSGTRVARQVVRRALEGCALTVEWWGPDGDAGLGTLAYDGVGQGWTQLWLTNQTPRPSRPIIRRQDATYASAGVRLMRAPDALMVAGRTDRLTVQPAAEGRVRQLLETSADSGRTWTVVFDVEHRRP